MHATLTDFGLAKAMGATTVLGTRTMMAGSPGYQAPEQLRAESYRVGFLRTELLSTLNAHGIQLTYI